MAKVPPNAGKSWTPSAVKELKTLELRMGLSVGAFDVNLCPLDPVSKKRLEKLISQALEWQPQTIWFDHFRFNGHWEAMRKNNLEGEHLPCKWCRGKNKVKELIKLASWLKSRVKERTEIGFFAVPFKAEEVPPVIEKMGQDCQQLGEIFDIVCPMLYHRMIEKPDSYITEFVSFLNRSTSKPILPIIQIKDLPDDLPDEYKKSEIEQAFQWASKSPSAGVAWFCWDDAVETGKTKIIKKLFNDVI